jgi:hypothetical protein
MFFTICIFAFNICCIVGVLRKDGFVFQSKQILKRIKFKTVLTAIAALGSVVVFGTIFATILPFTNFSWLQLFNMKGSNISVGPALDVASTNIYGKLTSAGYFLFLSICLPLFAKSEEQSFRRGNEDDIKYIVSSVTFGLVHCIVGVPVCMGMALIYPGFIFGWVYRRSFQKYSQRLPNTKSQDLAILDSTALHATYNLIVVSLVFLVIILV